LRLLPIMLDHTETMRVHVPNIRNVKVRLAHRLFNRRLDRRREIQIIGEARRECLAITDDIGQDFDVVYISNIIHMLSPAKTLALLEKAKAALVAGGRVLVKDFFLADSRVEPAWTAQFSVNMLVNTEGGKSYTFTEIKDLLARAGFGSLETVEIASNSMVIVGRRES